MLLCALRCVLAVIMQFVSFLQHGSAPSLIATDNTACRHEE